MTFVKRLIKNLGENDVFGTAAQAAFYLILSIAPLIFLAVSVAKNMDLSVENVAFINYIFPSNVSAIISKGLDNMPTSTHLPIISGVGVLFSASGGVWALMKGIHKAYNNEPLYFSIPKRLFAFFFTVVFIVSIVLSLGILIMGGVLTALNASLPFEIFADLGLIQRLLAALLIYVFIHFIYKVTPNVRLKGMELFWGALFATGGWSLVSIFFETYITYFTRYTSFYGGVGAFMILVLWLYIISFIIIVGAEINATLLELSGGKSASNAR